MKPTPVYQITQRVHQGGRQPPGTLDASWAVVCVDETPSETGAAITVHAPIPDEGWPGDDWLTDVVSILDILAQNRSVYVHCRAGVSRSVMVVAAYLLRWGATSVDAAMERIAKVNPTINPRKSFLDGLSAWHYSRRYK